MVDKRVPQAGSERTASYNQNSTGDGKRDKKKSKSSHRRHPVGMLIAILHNPMVTLSS
jgi:hypothetical protein